MEKCTNIINDLIENFKINRTTNAATWLTLILSLVAIWFVNKNKSNWKIWLLLIAALVVNFIISATFLAQDEDERRNSKLMTGTQVYAICILVAFVGLYASNKETRTLFIENPAVPAVLLTYLVLLIVSLSQQKNLTTAPGAPGAPATSKAPATSAAPPSSEPPVTSEEIPVDGSSKKNQLFYDANVTTIVYITFFVCLSLISFFLGGKEEEDKPLLRKLVILLLFILQIVMFVFTIQAFIENKDETRDLELQEKASKWNVGYYYTALIIMFYIVYTYDFSEANKDNEFDIGIISRTIVFVVMALVLFAPPLILHQLALKNIEENK